MLSLCICGTAITSQYLAERYKVNTPMLQSFINYCLLFLIYTVMLAFQSGSDNLLYILKKKWWKYILLGLADVEANYLIVRAYQYTTLTSVQTGNIRGVASIFWTQNQQVVEEYMMKMSESICSFGLLWDSCVDGSFVVYSLCKIQSDPLHCCGCLSVGCRNYGWCRHISGEGRKYR